MTPHNEAYWEMQAMYTNPPETSGVGCIIAKVIVSILLDIFILPSVHLIVLLSGEGIC